MNALQQCLNSHAISAYLDGRAAKKAVYVCVVGSLIFRVTGLRGGGRRGG